MNDRPVVLISGAVTEQQLARIQHTRQGADVALLASRADLEAQIEEAEVVAGGVFQGAALGRAKKLKWVQSWAAGPNELMYPEFVASSVIATSCKGNGDHWPGTAWWC